MSFGAGTAPDATATRHSSCAANLGGNTGNLLFFRINGGDSSANDNGMRAAIDLVRVDIGSNAKLYDFEPYVVASSKDDCKKDGWMGVSRADGSSFKNQGDCVSYAQNGK
jgi:hypothetical protein